MNQELIEQAVAYYAQTPPRGEYVLVVSGAEPRQEAVSLEQAVKLVQALIAEGSRTKDAVRQIAEETGLSKNALYGAVTKTN